MDELSPAIRVQQATDIHRETTISELVDMYGAEAVKRGLSYTQSLVEADKNFKESASSEQMAEGYDEADIDSEHENVQEASEEWAESMKNQGLGIDDN